ncbi:FtsK/SpoIIIE domain-containing protein [Catellatospora sichuanensis]|uniref:FtsK/SpoIIIE domain-containing protein n=1 Tax=Catellatospora sichuanensis TaxID=1969805 RepID=UPI001182E174|nr:FtsK/SpoIIIE domain-containing protein [Catellatospora sichuanensis]
MFGRAEVNLIECLCGQWVPPRQFHRAWHLCRECALRAKARLEQIEPLWPHLMTACKLTVRHWGTTYTPVIVGVYSRAGLDVLTIAVVPGQTRADFAKHLGRMAETFGVRRVAVRAGLKAGLVVLHLHQGDPLTAVVKPLPVPMVPDFTALPMGRRESGQTWTLRLHGGHCLVVGASDAGKGSFVQSFLRSVAGGISAGTVRVVGFDPKGGMEMAGAAPLLERFLCDSVGQMADALEDEVAVLNERTVALRGRTRQHVATVAEPKRIILIDELATLTAYGDKKTIDRVKAALALILTKGRAAGIHVVALVQDGRKEVVPLRNLFAIRVGLRMVEPAEVDLVLGDNARDRGALCDLIPRSMPGVGYVVDGDTDPERIRLSFPTDADIAALVAEYARPTAGKGR